MCNVACCGFCAGMSLFGSIFMFFIGILIQSRYSWVGEWYEKEELIDGQLAYHGVPTDEQVAKASKSCYVTGAFYIAWTVFAGVCVCYQRSKAAQKLN